MLVVNGVKTPEATTPMPRWRVDIVRKNAEHLGIVTAPNAQEALHRAAKLFRLRPDLHSKLIITKVGEHPVRALHRLAAGSPTRADTASTLRCASQRKL
jgi:hypothetical protein